MWKLGWFAIDPRAFFLSEEMCLCAERERERRGHALHIYALGNDLKTRGKSLIVNRYIY